MGFLLPLHLPSNIFGVVVVTPAALFIVYKIIHGLLSRSKLPPGPRGWPWIGYTPCLGSRAFNELQRLETIYGKIVSFQLLGKTVVVINDYQMIQQMDGPNRIRVGRYALTVNDLLARRLGMSNYDTPRALALRQAWLRHLYGYSEMINYLNNDPNKSDLAKAFETEVHTLIDTLHRLAGEPIRVDQLMRRTVWRMMWNLAFGSPCELSTGQIDRMIYDLSTNNMENSMLQISQMFPKFFIPILRYIPFTRSLLGIHKINARYDDIGQILNTEVARVLDKDRPRSAFLRRLKEDEKLAVQDDELKRLAFEVMAAGTDTTSLTLTWACAYLSCTREYFSPEDIRTHLMRIHRRASVVPLALPHLVRENIMISGYEIPAGSILIYNLYAVHQKQLEREETSPNPIPFSVGGRSCPGNRLATRVLEHIISEINKSFTVDRIDEGPADSSMKGLTRGPDNALFIFRPRNPVVNDVQRVVY